MKKEELKDLFRKYREGKCTEEEKALLEAWYLQYNEDIEIPSQRQINAVKNIIFLQLPGNEFGFSRVAIKLAAAAVLIGVVTTILFTFLGQDKRNDHKDFAADVPPGSNKAILTLSSGKIINLSDARHGNLEKSSRLTVTKNQKGLVSFTVPAESNDHSPNTIKTPTGGQWQVVLADGTKIWLNAATTLTFPTSFKSSTNRIVSLQGEAYFEVAKDAAHPFIVLSGKQRVEVLGTHFNINSYSDEPAITTTLLEGSVLVSVIGLPPQLLKPGQRSKTTDRAIEVKKGDINEAVAWKDGFFQFEDEPIQSVMRKLSRWYDIEVKYPKGEFTEAMNGRLSRYNHISQVLSALEGTGTVHFKTEGRRVSVMN